MMPTLLVRLLEPDPHDLEGPPTVRTWPALRCGYVVATNRRGQRGIAFKLAVCDAECTEGGMLTVDPRRVLSVGVYR